MRHAQSKSNAEKRIQGTFDNVGLSDNGIKNLYKMIDLRRDKLKEIKLIRYSTLKRAEETARIIGDLLEKPIFPEEKIIEVDSGILSGVTHCVAEKIYADYYEVWKKRGDLDKIPYAESGNEIQARVLAFLFLQHLKGKEIELIVTHAAFIRCLVNTYFNLPRDNPVLIAHDVLHELQEPWNKLNVNYLVKTERKVVCVITTFDNKYVLKFKSLDENITYIEKINRQIVVGKVLGGGPNIYYQCRENNYSLIIEEYLKGEHKCGLLNMYEERQVFLFFSRLRQLFNNMGIMEYSIRDKICTIIARSISKQACEMGKYALNQLDKKQYEKAIVYDDAHRNNILFAEGKVYLVDCDSFILASDVYQLASILCCTFLMSGYEIIDIERLSKLWPVAYSLDEILSHIYVRAYIGYAYFCENETLENKKLKHSYYTILCEVKKILEDYTDEDSSCKLLL